LLYEHKNCILFPYTTLFRYEGQNFRRLEIMDKTNQVDNCRKQKTILGDDSPEGEVNLGGHSRDKINPKQKTEYELLDKILDRDRSEEHTSELQSRFDLVCRL